jgi:multidrug efflux pump
MTSMAFTLGVLPLFLATGAGSASQRAIGTGVVGGMLTGTLFAVFFVPAFYVLVRWMFPPTQRQQMFYRHETENQNLHVPTEDR